jgi:Homoserine dehydrogenase
VHEGAHPGQHRLAAARCRRADRDRQRRAASAVSCPSGSCAEDPAKISLTGIYLGQAVVAIVAALLVSSEYGTGMIRLTLTAIPRRISVLAAKAAILTAWSWPPEPSPPAHPCWPGGSSCPATASAPPSAGTVTARVEPELVRPDDPLASIGGVTNAVVCQASPVGEVAIIGPGAGPQVAGQGALSDIVAVARWRPRSSSTAVAHAAQLGPVARSPGESPSSARDKW